MRVKKLTSAQKDQIVYDFLLTEDAGLVASRYNIEPHDVLTVVVQVAVLYPPSRPAAKPFLIAERAAA